MEFRAETTVQDVLTSYPHLFDVFEKRGMCDSCKVSPPPVPLFIFAQKHCQGDLESLINELEANRKG